MEAGKFIVGAFIAVAGIACIVHSTSPKGSTALSCLGTALLGGGAAIGNSWLAAAGAACVGVQFEPTIATWSLGLGGIALQATGTALAFD